MGILSLFKVLIFLRILPKPRNTKYRSDNIDFILASGIAVGLAIAIEILQACQKIA